MGVSRRECGGVMPSGQVNTRVLSLLYPHNMKWTTAVSKARKKLRITGFQPIKKGTALYKTAKQFAGTSTSKPTHPKKHRRRRH